MHIHLDATNTITIHTGTRAFVTISEGKDKNSPAVITIHCTGDYRIVNDTDVEGFNAEIKIGKRS